MPRTCTVCSHAAREAIDHALVAGESAAQIAGRYRTLHERALRRHRDAHIPESLAKSREAEEVSRADDLLRQLKALQAKTLALLLKAEEAGDLRTALAGIREARGNVELLAKLSGELDERPVNILLTPEWLEVRAVIVSALEPHPQAWGAVLRALEGGGNGGA